MDTITQNYKSKPLFEESEEEKRRREAAKNYLSARSTYEKAGIGAANPYSMSRDAYRSSDPAVASSLTGSLKTATESALKAGIGGPVMANDVLNKGQARIVGDTLVGAAAGISSSEWDKRDKAVAAGGKPPMPTREMVEVAPGVKMGLDTARNYYASRNNTIMQENQTADRQRKAADTVNTSIAQMRQAAKDRDALSKQRSENFFAGIAQRKSDEALANQNLRDTRRAASNARLVESAMKDALRRYRFTNGKEGALVTPDAMEKASSFLAGSLKGLGPYDNEDARRKSFVKGVQNERERKQKELARLNPYQGSI
jgi:hypothetical protein